MLHGRGLEAYGARLFSLVVFFETYIDNGADVTEVSMRLLSRRKTKKLMVIAGGAMDKPA